MINISFTLFKCYKITTLLLIAALVGCNTEEHESQLKSVPNENASRHEIKDSYKIIYETSSLGKDLDSIYVIYESSFAKDTVRFFSNDKKMEEKIITTDHFVGMADETALKWGANSVTYFQFNSLTRIKLDSINLFPYLFISKELDSDTISLEFSTVPRMYK